MPFMHWSDEYSIGIALFDEEHMRLVAMANELYDAVFDGKSDEAVTDVFQKLLDYTGYHFSREEAFFVEAGYPYDAAHKARHHVLKQQVIDFEAQTRDLPKEIQALEMAKFLKRWIEIHILKDDREYGDYLTAKGIH